MPSGQTMLEEFQNHLAKEEKRRDDADEKLQRASRILVQVKAGVEHLADKLHHLKAVSMVFLGGVRAVELLTVECKPVNLEISCSCQLLQAVRKMLLLVALPKM